MMRAPGAPLHAIARTAPLALRQRSDECRDHAEAPPFADELASARRGEREREEDELSATADAPAAQPVLPTTALPPEAPLRLAATLQAAAENAPVDVDAPAATPPGAAVSSHAARPGASDALVMPASPPSDGEPHAPAEGEGGLILSEGWKSVEDTEREPGVDGDAEQRAATAPPTAGEAPRRPVAAVDAPPATGDHTKEASASGATPPSPAEPSRRSTEPERDPVPRITASPWPHVVAHEPPRAFEQAVRSAPTLEANVTPMASEVAAPVSLLTLRHATHAAVEHPTLGHLRIDAEERPHGIDVSIQVTEPLAATALSALEPSVRAELDQAERPLGNYAVSVDVGGGSGRREHGAPAERPLTTEAAPVTAPPLPSSRRVRIVL